MSFKLALVQPLSHRPPDDAENVTDAVRFVDPSGPNFGRVLELRCDA